MYIKRLFCILLLSSILIDCQPQAKRVRIFEFGPMLGIMFPPSLPTITSTGRLLRL